MTLSDEISRLEELRKNGTLTEEEFTRAKARLLNEAGTAPPLVSAINGMRRSRTDQWIGGVCGGLAKATGLDSWAWRVIFAALFVCAGAGLVLYILLWIFVPSE